MDLTGKIIVAMPQKSGTSQRTGSPWVVQEFVLETQDQFPRKLAFEVFGEDRLKQFNIQVGGEYKVSFDIDANEWNGRWYNRIRAFSVTPVAAVVPPAGPTGGGTNVFPPVDGGNGTPQPPTTAQPAGETTLGGSADDLPF